MGESTQAQLSSPDSEQFVQVIKFVKLYCKLVHLLFLLSMASTEFCRASLKCVGQEGPTLKSRLSSTSIMVEIRLLGFLATGYMASLCISNFCHSCLISN